ncbi:chloroplastic group IIA intron splicing facilitator CRS1, chloroplastic [Primulina huaijiensis]|uniref:chloroplastic group IIA intron splicing facilitator CRS1, chloroplastic n=1 Tax=Primulina huaijiensis TaxID=1492673 RepID=UPI003CC74AA5
MSPPLPFSASNRVASCPHNSTLVLHSFLLFNPAKSPGITFSGPRINASSSTKLESRSAECGSQKFYPKSSEPISDSGSPMKTHTAPWMNGPLLVKPEEILRFRRPKSNKDHTLDRFGDHPDIALSGKVGGGRGKVAMKRIYKGIEKLQESQDVEEIQKEPENFKYIFPPNEFWGDGGYENDAEVGRTFEVVQEPFKTVEFGIPLEDVEKGVKSKKLPWEREERMVTTRVKKEKVATAAESSLDGELLRRLRSEAAIMKTWVKVKKAGVTEAVVNQVILIWRSDELALLKFDLPLCRNLDRAREIVELKTGGVVVWSKKDFLAVYRGCNYVSRSRHHPKIYQNPNCDRQRSSSSMNYEKSTTIDQLNFVDSSPGEMSHGKDGKWEIQCIAPLYERESDRLLDELGPRFVDWWMPKPLPVDADLLPEHSPGFKTPFRLCPPHTRSQLTDSELTYLRKIARPLPTHFVLGRNRKLQGLATAILKLWEKCHIAKIALKWGIPNTDNEQMAHELKILTGGTLLLRNKFFIIFYRGKDFLPSKVANLVAERETELTSCHVHEETARLKASETFSITHEHAIDSGIIGTLSEFHNIQSVGRNLPKGKSEIEVQLEAEQETLEREIRYQQRRHFILKKKIERSAYTLDKLNHAWRRSEKDPDQEIISQEERECLRMMGLKLDSSLVLGRRGVFNGVIEGMHQHWKHREIVKVITMQKKFSQVIDTAKFLETESGGILVSVVKIKIGHAIIVYRGKNYKRPRSMPQNLLTNRDAFSRSIEMQRIGSLKFFAKQREQKICDLELQLDELRKRMFDYMSK